MKTTFLKTFAFIAASGLVITSCNKDKENLDEIFDSAEDHAMMEGEFSNVHDYMDNQAQDKPGFGKANISILPGCGMVYTNTTSNPKILEITFFDSSNTANGNKCLCSDGNYRKGKIHCEFTGQYRTQGAKVVITLIDYYVNETKYTGTRTVTNLGNASGNWKYSYKVTGASAATPEGTATWTTDGELTRIEGDGTINPFDDVYLFTGSSTGVSRKGKNFTVTVTTPLKKKIGCRNIVSGKTNITNSNGNTMELDFDPIGGEPCDRIAKITYKDKTKTITLR